MAVKLRMTRVGKLNRPLFRICAVDSRRARDGAYLENLGFYDPFIADDGKKFRIKKERVEYWLSVGAQPSQTLLDFLKKAKVSGLIRPKPKRKRRRKAVSLATVSLAAGGGAPGHVSGTPLKGGGTKARKPPKKPKLPEGGPEAGKPGPAGPVDTGPAGPVDTGPAGPVDTAKGGAPSE